jgi:hypothetical protein
MSCKYANCTKNAEYGLLGSSEFNDKPTRCFEHRERDMVILKYKCRKNGCRNTAIFGYKSLNIPYYCDLHKLSDRDIDVSSSVCQYEDCINRATYNHHYFQKPKYCEDHKENDMIDINFIRCSHSDCKLVALYGNKNKPTHCIVHKNDKMHTFSNKVKCPALTAKGSICGNTVCFGYRVPDRCMYHYRKKEYIDELCEKYKILSKDIKITCLTKNNICIEDGCEENAVYAPPYQIPKYCIEHKNTHDVGYTTFCAIDGCLNKVNNIKQHYCAEHRQSDEKIKNNTCVCENCENCNNKSAWLFDNRCSKCHFYNC